ncbi:MAG TPA: UDP-N-acetylglucosamine--N-acetylmuramyl-(pentapeptide) pyrophosphoryl-undecaprenol N-acetylglucosamine transferase [Phycisphaerae bacterium]|nr:UDP-N-acetylglucosamine--N-acetylmuramyl-(pentapeptide) pyrophosphoryl-undecaprenol N-acetylglucosamine transferase [Phycisphaerae bacterium]
MTTVQANPVEPAVERPGSPASAPLFVFAGGGTGGHLYPALAVAQALRARLKSVRVVFFGTERAIDAQVLAHAGESLVPQGVRPLTLRPWRMPGFLRAWREAVQRCRTYFATHRPAMVIGTGGFASAPAIRVAAHRGIPTALMNPDLVPGKANRYLARSVECIFAQFEETRRHFPTGTWVEAAGCPVRPAFRTAIRAASYPVFELDPNKKTLLVTGASLGARSVNAACVQLAPALAEQADWQVLHLAGREDVEHVRAAYAAAGVAARVLAYTEQMPAAMAVADLMVARAGASTIAEILAAAVPAVLLPYPHHRDRHQLAHALLLERHGVAITCLDAAEGEKTAETLRGPLTALMANEGRRAQMRLAARALDHPNAAERIARRVLELAGCPAST